MNPVISPVCMKYERYRDQYAGIVRIRPIISPVDMHAASIRRDIYIYTDMAFRKESGEKAWLNRHEMEQPHLSASVRLIQPASLVDTGR